MGDRAGMGMGVTCAGLVLALSTKAAAVPAFEPIQETDLAVVAPSWPIPRNGAIVLKLATGDEEVPAVIVSREEGDAHITFGGTLRHVTGSYWAWTPSTPLDPGSYAVSLVHGALGSVSAAITIAGDADLEAGPQMTAEPVASLTDRPVEYANCFGWRGTKRDSATSPFPVRATLEAEVTPNLTFDEPSLASQFLYRALRVGAGDEDPPFLSIDELIVVGPYVERADEYCFSLELMDVATSTVQPGPTYCAEHGELADDFGEHAVEHPDRNFDRYKCPTAPEGYEAQWCRANDYCIEVWAIPERVDEYQCRWYYDRCPDAERPDAAPPEADAGAQPAPAPAPPRTDSGCATTRGSNAGATPALIASALLLLALVRSRARGRSK